MNCCICNKAFEASKTTHVYCSNVCRNRAWRANNREKYRLKQIKWIQENTEQHLKNQREYKQQRSKTDLLYKLKRRVRARLGRIKFKNSGRTTDWLGCSIADLKAHLESKFQSGMTWDNYGDWHIDHIVPLASATNEQETLKLCYYTNLQPLWAKDNLSKGDNL